MMEEVKLRILWTIHLLITICILSFPAYAKYGGGMGEPNDPYLIYTAEQMNEIGLHEEDWSKRFKLMSDIDLSAYPGTAFNLIGYDWWRSFRGVFDGNGHTISNFNFKYTDRPDSIGIFRHVRGKIKDLGLIDPNIDAGTGSNVGSLVGKLWGWGSISNCYAQGVSVSGSWRVGGLVGNNLGRITNCYGTGSVSGTRTVGGLVGRNASSVGTVATISNCYSTGSVSGTGDVGGLVGYNGEDGDGSIATSYSTGIVTGNGRVGGLIGHNSGSVGSCYSTGTVSGSRHVGGLAGYNRSRITSSYSTSSVSGNEYVGGLVGSGLPINIQNNVWDIETSGLIVSAGGVGLSTSEMMDSYMLGINGFANDPNWVLDAGRDYPRLTWEGTPGQIIPEANVDWLQGGGTAEDPYRVKTADQLILLGRASTLCDSHLVLDADIDLDPNLQNGEVFGQAVIPAFTGSFNGNGYTISNLTITGVEYLGVFGQLGSGAEVRDLGVVDVNITGSSTCGGLVGCNFGSVTNCYSSCSVSGEGSIGGLVGINRSSVFSCYSTVVVSGTDYVGGLVGYNTGSVNGCHSTGTVTGDDLVGGLIGDSNGSITASYSTCTVSGSGMATAWHPYDGVGGLVGSSGGSITESSSTGMVSGDGCVGGLVGSNSGLITTSYSTATVTGNEQVGGLVGQNWRTELDHGLQRNDGSIAASYSTGIVSGNEDVGGFVGNGDPKGVCNSLWDMDTSGLIISAGGVGLSTSEMMDTYMLGLNGFANDPNWILDAGRDYPRLAWEGKPGEIVTEPNIDWLDGQGTEEEPYRIDTAAQLILISKASILWDEHFILDADIDLNPALPERHVFRQSVIQVFKGVFDGSGHVILHLTIEGGSFLGLFGRIESGAEVKNLGLVDVSINGLGNHVTGLVGYNSGSVNVCYSTGTVSGSRHVGGLVGENNGVGGINGIITASCSTATVIASDFVGGLVGGNNGIITASYSTATVSGDSFVGGLAGQNGDRIASSFSTGTVSGSRHVGGLVGYNKFPGPGSYPGRITSSFWDMETSEQEISAGGTGLTTNEMQTTSTFLDAGWDFVDETANGTEDIWWILEGQDYPRLWWELIPEN